MACPTAKVVVVTGASAGVGRATAVAFARCGATVALLARSTDGLQGVAREIQALGGTALILPTDVADPAQVEQAAERAEKELGPIDVWVNNAMVTVFSRVMDMTDDDYKRVTEVTYLGTVHGTRAALRRMRARNRGTIIQVGSALAYRGIPIQSAYCAAKFAGRGFTDSLRAELIYEKSDIHITMVHLAAFNTPQFEWARHRLNARPMPLPPIFQPELAARAIVWSASHRRREIYVGLPALKTIIANKIFPGLSDYLAARQAVSGQMDHNAPPPDPDRKDNLYQPVPGDFGAHGRFDAMARDASWHLFITLHRHKIALLILVIVVILLGMSW